MKSIFRSLNEEYRLDRRELLQLSALGVLAPTASGWFPSLAAYGAEAAKAGHKPKSCILLWMSGGPSQVHTFNIPTEGRYQEYKGMQTAVPGIHISEYLPKLAAAMKDLALVQSMSTGLNEHGSAHFLMHTGFRQSLTVDYPSLGAILSKTIGRPDSGLPNYVCIGAGGVAGRIEGPGFLGEDHAPLMIASEKSGIVNLKPPVPSRAEARAALLDEVENAAFERFQADVIKAHQSSYRRALELMRTDKTKAFDLKSEPASSMEKYGKTPFGQQCLLARRLVEAGVAFVEVAWGGHSGVSWDSHGGGAEAVKKKSPELDQGFSALLADLKERGLLDSTLVIWMGEFGRGPRPGLGGGINSAIGGGHYAKAWTTVLAGAGLRTGQIIGKTTKDACEVTERPVSAPDFFATICRALAIDPHQEIGAPGGRPHSITPKASQPITELFS